MSSQNRIRVLLSDSKTQPPDNMIVLFRQRVGWVMLLGSFLALLCLPAHRQLFLNQVEAIKTRKPPAWAVTEGVEASDPRVIRQQARLKDTLRRHPDDAWLHVGAIPLGRVSREIAGSSSLVKCSGTGELALPYLEQLRSRFPEDRLVLGVLMSVHSDRYVGVRRVESLEPNQRPVALRGDETRLLDAAVLRQVETLAAEAARIDPDNGYPPTMLAIACFAAGRDREGLQALHRASLLPRWDDYSTATAAAGLDLLVRTYGDQGFWMHAIPRYQTSLRYLHKLWRAARVAQWCAFQARARADREEEHRLRTDLIRLGGQIRRHAPTAYVRQMGAEVQDLGFRVEERAHPGAAIVLTTAVEEEVRVKQRRDYLDRVRREAPQLAGPLEEEARTLQQFRARYAVPVHDEELQPNLMVAWLQREVIGLSLLANGLALSALALLISALSLLVRRLRREAPPVDRRSFWTRVPATLRIAVLAVTPFAVLLLCDRVIPLWSAWGWQLPALVFGFLLLPILRRREGGAVSWTGAHGLVIALLALGVVAFALNPGGLHTVTDGYWRQTSAGDAYWYHTVDPELFQVRGAGWIIGPAPLLWALLPAAVLTALLRRASVAGVIGALHVGAKTLAGGLAVSYIVYLLLSVPANEGAVHALEETLRQVS